MSKSRQSANLVSDNNIFVDIVNDRVGIGIINPTVKLHVIGDVISGTHLPEETNAHDLGSSQLRWKTIFTQDLELSNGIGDYTIVEGEDDLFIYNNKKGKVYKFALIEVDPSEATPKMVDLNKKEEN
jgi:hypothetical protein